MQTTNSHVLNIEINTFSLYDAVTQKLDKQPAFEHNTITRQFNDSSDKLKRKLTQFILSL